jgi:thiosulfate/3-mercaptopyruvate sulfurtransferase
MRRCYTARMKRILSALFAFALLLAPPCVAQGTLPTIVSATVVKEFVAQHGDGSVQFLDVRNHDAFIAGHLPSAVWIDADAWKKRSSDKEGLTDAARWEDAFREVGLNDPSVIVVYGEPMPEVARIWWLLKYSGLANVSVLDGGLNAWREEDGPIETAVHPPATGTVTVAFQPDRLIELDAVRATDRTCQLIDHRTEGEYLGTDIRGERGGHIPGVKWLDWSELVDANQRFKDDETLRQMYAKRGIDIDQPAAVHCQSGGRSSVGALVIEHLTGKPVANYYRSWAEYSASDAPVENETLPSKAP